METPIRHSHIFERPFNGRLLRVPLAGLTLALASCANADLTRQVEPALFGALDALAYPAAPALLTGFAAADRDPELRPGDAALIGLELRNGERERRLLGLLEVERTAGSELSDATLTWFTATGERLGDHRVPLEPTTRTEEQDQLGPIPSLLMTGVRELLKGDRELRDLALSIPDRPGLLDWFTNSGRDLALDTSVEDGTWRPAAVASDQSLDHATIHVRWGELPVARADLLLLPPLGPFALTAGVVGAELRSPTDPARRVTVRLLANRRGS